MRTFDSRLVIGVGFALFAASNFMNVWMSVDTAGDQFLWPNIVRAIGQALVLAPLAAVTAAGIEKENAGSASAVFNMMRNLGGAIGIAALQTFLTKREQFHSNVIGQSVSLFDEATRNRIDGLVRYFMAHGVTDPALAWHKAVIAIGARIQQQAFTMAFGDVFFVLGVALVIAMAAALLFRKTGVVAGGGAH
jgi:DHA2 family multidrug resistance protein